MAIKIAFANHKGGVGKTTCVVNTAFRLARMGYKTLVVDCDPQGNATHTLGGCTSPLAYRPEQTLSALFSQDTDITSIAELAIPANMPKDNPIQDLHFVPNNIDIYPSLTQIPGYSTKRFLGVFDACESADKEYDFILLDTPPTLEGVLLCNALIAADHVVIVIESESIYALTGIQNLLNAVKTINSESKKNKTNILGILLTKHDGRTKAAKLLQQATLATFGDQNPFSTTIPNSTKVNQAAMRGTTICDLEPEGTVCKAFKAFTDEVIARVGITAK